MKINDTLLTFWKVRCTLFPLFSWHLDGVWQHAVGDDCRTKHSLARVCDLMVLIFVDSLRKYECGSDLAIFPVLAIFPKSIYTVQFKKKVALLHVYNEVTSEPTVTRYTTIVRKTLKICF
jgi:hypothetical protein